MDTNTEETTSSSPASQTSEPTSGQASGKAVVSSQSRKFRIIRTLLLPLILLAGIGGVLVFSIFMSRPTWHTVLGDGKPGSLVIAVDCPDNWKRINMSAANARALAAVRPDIIQFKRQPPTGFLGWWTRVVLHQDDNAADAAQITVMVIDNSSFTFFGPKTPRRKNAVRATRETEILDNMEKGLAGSLASQPGYHITKQRVQHPLGPALQIKYDIDTALIPAASRNKATRGQIAELWGIVPYKAPTNGNEYFLIICSSPAAEAWSLKTVYAEVIQRVHFAKKP